MTTEEFKSLVLAKLQEKLDNAKTTERIFILKEIIQFVESVSI